MNVKRFDSVGSGTSVATFITKQKIAEISLNEVDVAKIKIGDKTTLTFDAIPDLTITGTVAEIDSLGTVSQGVVTYNVKISFDTQDDRVKPSMSVSASIITQVKQDVLMVPNSTVKTKNGTSYVQTFTPTLIGSDSTQGVVSLLTPNQTPVVIGLSNDTSTEIISGINEGDQIVLKATTVTATTSTTAPSLLGAIGGNRTATGGANTRALRAN